MLTSLLVRSLVASLCAWLLVLCGVAATWPGGNQDVRMLVDRSIMVVGYGSALFGLWWLVDAVVLRPLLLPRIGWFGLAPIECVFLCANDILPRLFGMLKVEGLSGIVHAAKEMAVFYAAYLAVSVLLLHILSRLAYRKASLPDS